MHLRYCRGGKYGGTGADAYFNALLEHPDVRAEFERSHKLPQDPRVTRVGRWLRAL